MAHQITKATTLVILLIVVFRELPMTSARILGEKFTSISSKALFQKLGFDLSKYQKTNARLLREAPGGPDPHHHDSPSPPAIRVLREAPGGPDPHHDSPPPAIRVLREAPGGPDPHHDSPPPAIRVLREAPGGPDPHHDSPSPPAIRVLREAPGGPDPHHHATPPKSPPAS